MRDRRLFTKLPMDLLLFRIELFWAFAAHTDPLIYGVPGLTAPSVDGGILAANTTTTINGNE